MSDHFQLLLLVHRSAWNRGIIRLVERLQNPGAEPIWELLTGDISAHRAHRQLLQTAQEMQNRPSNPHRLNTAFQFPDRSGMGFWLQVGQPETLRISASPGWGPVKVPPEMLVVSVGSVRWPADDPDLGF